MLIDSRMGDKEEIWGLPEVMNLWGDEDSI